MKKYFIAVVIAIVCYSCKSNVHQNVTNQQGVPVDLVLFDVSGPVKSITYETGFLDQFSLGNLNPKTIKRNEVYNFSAEGVWDEEIAPSTIVYDDFDRYYGTPNFNYKVERNNGCVVKITGTPFEDEEDFEFYEFQLRVSWDTQNNVIRMERYFLDGSPIGNLIEFSTYLASRNAILFELGEMSPSISKVQVLERDEYDNWTRRKIVNVLREGSIVQQRHIEYYSKD